MVPLLRLAASLRVRGDGGAGGQPLHQGDTEHTLPPLHRKEGNSIRERSFAMLIYRKWVTRLNSNFLTKILLGLPPKGTCTGFWIFKMSL